MRAAIGVLVSTFSMFSTILTGCGGGSSSAPAAGTPPASAAECAQRLEPRSVARPAARREKVRAVTAEPPSAARPSRLVVHARLSLARLGAELERNIAPRLADGNNVKLGPAG